MNVHSEILMKLPIAQRFVSINVPSKSNWIWQLVTHRDQYFSPY